MGITSPNLSYYMKGREPSYDTLIEIAEYFNVSIDYLLGKSKYKTSKEEADTLLLQEKVKEDSKYKDFEIDTVDNLDIYCVQKAEKAISKALYSVLISGDKGLAETVENFAYAIYGMAKISNAQLTLGEIIKKTDDIIYLFKEIEKYYQGEVLKILKGILSDENSTVETKHKCLEILHTYWFNTPDKVRYINKNLDAIYNRLES